MTRPRVLLVGATLLVLLLALAALIPRGADDGGLQPSGRSGATATGAHAWGLSTSPGGGRVTPAMAAEIDRVVAEGRAAGRLTGKQPLGKLVGSLVRCAELDGQRYCLGLGWTDLAPAQPACGCSSVGRARPSQGRCREFESRHPLTSHTDPTARALSGRCASERTPPTRRKVTASAASHVTLRRVGAPEAQRGADSQRHRSGRTERDARRLRNRPGTRSRDTQAVTRRQTAAVLSVVVLAFSACASEKDPEPSRPTAQPSASAAPAGGTPDRPAAVDQATSLLEWVAAPGAVDNTVTTNGTWFLTVEASGQGYRLDGPDQSFGTGAEGVQITNALLDTDWAVVVRQDRSGKKPASAEVTDLGKGEQFTIDEGSDLPTISGGTWALGGDTLAHATTGPDGGYCVATVDLVSRASSLAWCAAAKHGFNAAHVTEGGTTVLGFDDAKPSCRTVGTVADDGFVAFPGVPECKAWEGAVLGDDETVWSVIPKENDVDAAEFFARDGEDYYDLGPGTSGTLVPCADAAYFVRDPQLEGDPARLLRWDGRTLDIVFEASPGQSFLDAPRCGDGALVLTAHSEAGDDQLMAALG